MLVTSCCRKKLISQVDLVIMSQIDMNPCACAARSRLIYDKGDQVRSIQRHRPTSSVNFGGGKTFFPKIMHEKSTKCPNFTRYVPEKMSQFYTIIARKNIFPDFFWGGGAPAPFSTSTTLMPSNSFYHQGR